MDDPDTLLDDPDSGLYAELHESNLHHPAPPHGSSSRLR